MRNIIFAFLLLAVTGCSLQQQNSNHLANQLEHENPADILKIIEEKIPDDSDRVQHNLNLGYLQLLSGKFDLAISSLTAAKEEMKVLSATSISENIGAGTVNETLRSYSGYPTDRITVHNMLALSYLFNNDIDGARVEMLQASVSMEIVAEDDKLIGQLASTHLLSAVIYELLDERSNAFISYQFAENILTKRKMPVPNGLKLALLRMSYKVGNNAEYRRYSKKYSPLTKPVKGNKQIFNLHFDGVVSNKSEVSLSVNNPGSGEMLRIAMPTYLRANHKIQRMNLSDSKKSVRSELIENINTLVREDLKNEYPSILLATTLRAATKHTAVRTANKANPIVGLLLNIFTVVSEVADVRSWNMLPATVQFAYLDTSAKSVKVSKINTPDNVIALNRGNQHVILTSSLSNQILHYQQ